jgi:hypothetical protein
MTLKSYSCLVGTLLAAGCGPGGYDPSGALTCAATNCTGCCSNGVCLAGNTAAACGSSGLTCETCVGNESCGADRSCGLDQDATWIVQPVAASITPTNNGSSWDGDNSAPDVQVETKCPGQTASVLTPESAAYNATWSTGGCTAKVSQLLSGAVAFRLWDADVAFDDSITAEFTYRFLDDDLISGTKQFPALGAMISLKVTLARQQ